MSRTILLVMLSTLLLAYAWADREKADITVYKNAFCGCCTNWAAYLQDQGFNVKEEVVENVNVYKQKYGVPHGLGSCHTAIVEGYVIEGHVPADDIRRLLRDRPDIKGLSAPGMPIGSPGMEQGDRKDAFDVIALRKDGSQYVYSSHRGG